MKTHTLITILTASLCLTAFGEVDHRLKRDREKEAGRCMERANWHGNAEEFEKKFGWAKKDFGHQLHGLREKRMAASRAWKEAAAKIKHAENHAQIDAVKMAAYQAGAEAYLAELELKADSSEKKWKESAEKIGTREAEQAARQLIENQRNTIEVHKAKMLREHQLRQLAWQKHELGTALEKEYHEMRQKEEQARNKGRKPSNTNGRPLKKPDHDKPAARPDPPKIRIE